MMKQGVDHGFPLGFEKKRKKQAVSGNNKRKSRSKESRAAPFSVLSDIS